MHNFNSAAPHVRGYVEFKHQGSWRLAIGNPFTGEPIIFKNKNEAMEQVLAILKVGDAIVAVAKDIGSPVPTLPTVDEYRFVPVEVPKSMDAEPADLQAASDVLKAAAAKAKGGAA